MTPIQDKINRETQAHTIPFNDTEVEPSYTDTTIQQGIVQNMNSEIELPYQLCLSTDQFDNVINIQMNLKGTHETMA